MAERVAVVGVWRVDAVEAPFPRHLMTFHADGTLAQTNPEAGHPGASCSDGMGVWRCDGARVTARFVELTADRATRESTGHTVVELDLLVRGDRFTGTAGSRSFDTSGVAGPGPATTGVTGSRLSL